MRVLLPKWWTQQEEPVYGETDGEDTYCCDATPAWFVEVEEFEYEGYFQKTDLVVV